MKKSLDALREEFSLMKERLSALRDRFWRALFTDEYLAWLDAQFPDFKDNKRRFLADEFTLLMPTKLRALMDEMTPLFRWPPDGEPNFWDNHRRDLDRHLRDHPAGQRKYLTILLKRFYPRGPRYVVA